ncbi:MAG: response regulator, partial [Myxococcota bacterium]
MAQILVVDDEEDLRVLLTRILEGEGHEVTAARNGEVALDWVQKKAFDLLI